MTPPEPPRVRLQLLGPVTTHPPITGPRRIAVLAYLAIARPHGLHSRDTLIGLLWPDADQPSARHALRNALHSIRQTLGPLVISSGDAMVGIDPRLVDCDALELEADLAARRLDAALARYQGELLQGFFVSDAPEFERWLDAERRRVADAVRDAAWDRAESLRASEDAAVSIAAARRAAALAPEDEPSARRLMRFLGDAGDRAGALRAYEEFAAHLRREFDAEPSAETLALAKSLRETPSDDAVRAAAPRLRMLGPVEEAPSENSRIVVPASKAPATARTRWASFAFAAVTAAAVGTFAASGRRTSTDSSRRLVVFPMDNQTGDTSFDYVATGVADGVGRRLEGLGGLHVLSAARSEWPDSVRQNVRGVLQRYPAAIGVRSSLVRSADSLEVRASIVLSDTPDERPIAAKRFALTDIAAVERDIAAEIAATLFRTPVSEMPHAPARAADPESYRLTLLGFHQLLRLRDDRGAVQSFTRATELDGMNARAYAGLSSAYASQAASARGTFDESSEHATAAAERALSLDSLDGTAWVNLGFIRALTARRLSVGLPFVTKAARVDPANPEVFMVIAALRRHAWQWDDALDAIRIARRLDPLTPYYVEREVTLDLCAQRFDDALKLVNEELAINPGDTTALQQRARTVALLGHPLAGYWDTVQARARRRAEAAGTGAHGRPIDPVALYQIQFAAGDTTSGFKTLEAAVVSGDRNLYKLPCTPEVDGVRNSSHFQAILRKVGPLPAK